MAKFFETVTVREELPYTPIRLKTGVERQSVIDDAVQQIKEIVNRLTGS